MTSYKNPGFLTPDKFQRENLHSTNPPEFSFARRNTHSVDLNQVPNRVSSNFSKFPQELEDENSGPISVSMIGEIEPPQVEVTEYRLCTKCDIEQPNRTKHCPRCGHCVALHDHHCVWLGTCVGLRNRFYFWWYLLFQTVFLWYSEIMVLTNLEDGENWEDWVYSNVALLLAGVGILFFLVNVTSLLGFHTYLIMVNLTTWEFLSWHRISYINKWPKKKGSPFSRGCFSNVKLFCCKSLPGEFYKWSLPADFPKL